MIVCRSLESLLYCWRTQQKCVVLNPCYINRFDDKYATLNLEEFNATNAYEYWANLCFCMSITGLLLCPDNVENIREDDGATIATKGSKLFKPNSNFVEWLDQEEDAYDVYDYFDVRSARLHNIDIIKREEEFVKKINFFPSPRLGVTQTKDLVATSCMTHEQLLNPDWGNGIVRIKVLRMMQSEGITGPMSVRTESKTYYKKPKIDFFKRVVSKKILPRHSLLEVAQMKQNKGEAWKTVQILKQK